ncbi:VpsP family polysaccharide biosynthesis protein [Microbulbifer pacificus]|uniref:VpsP family polysaccharide biosynthesis protein n=1 Tax=Microbulbifer pacificus TaxID=407164 RepID=A0AAU0MW23_9GAMM|nr:VpsP family polysaccharide biosynthesis protein [Microbulbifer pacificus]WOX04850.1 VpsP family polysaccharide biosynthesis protein [Microbulbifer pacificus]
MNTQSLAESSSSGRRRRRRSRARNSFAAKALSFVWPEQVGFARKLGTWLTVVALIYLAGHAGALGLAHLQVIRVENQLEYWYKRGEVPSSAAMVSALNAIEQANRLHPDNPYQLTLQARLLEWRAYNDGNVIPQDYRAALALHQRAAALRPLWPDTWGEMAQIKARLNEFDSVLEGYLKRANQLGPYTPAVHVAVAQTYLPRLPLLGGDQLALLEAQLLRGVYDHRSRNQIIGLVELYGQQGPVCQWLQGEKGVQKLCPKR